MANIMINQNCNLNCKYCFANEFVNNDASQDMTFENFKVAISYHKNNDDRVGIIGGEPTIHPEFEKFMQYTLDNTENNPIVIFSNGIELYKYWKMLIDQRVSTLINYNGPEISGKSKFAKINDALEKLHTEYGLGSKISIGVNLYSNDMDLTYLFDTLKKYNKKVCRYSIIVPNNSSARDFNALAYFKSMKPILLKFFELCYINNIEPSTDCNCVPQCIMSEKEDKDIMERLFKLYGGKSRLFQEAKCTPILDIQPNLQVVRCFGMSDYKKLRLNDYGTLNDIDKVFYQLVDKIGGLIPMSTECENCFKYATGDCYGGCLGYKFSKMQRLAKVFGKEIDNEFKCNPKANS